MCATEKMSHCAGISQATPPLPEDSGHLKCYFQVISNDRFKCFLMIV